MTPEQTARLESAISAFEAATADDFSIDEKENLRKFLRLYVRVLDFFDSLGWIGRLLAKLAGWIIAMWALFELIAKVKS